MLHLTGQVCEDVADYEFHSVLKLLADYGRGVFAPAFRRELAAYSDGE
jgi:hypothetical protein